MEHEIIKELNHYKKYKAYFVGVEDQQKKEFKDSKCVMIISVGQKYHEDGELHAAINLINKHFLYCNVLVCDTLQKYSMRVTQQNKSENELYVLAKNAGKQWIERNMKYISTFTIPYVVSRWDDWLTQSNYQYYYQKVCKLYSETSYKDTVDEIANEFLLRRSSLNIANQQLAFDLCIKYLLEESAVACLWVEAGYKFDLYPTRSNMAMIMAYKKLTRGKVDFEAQSLMLNIKKVSKNTVTQLKTEEYKNIATNYILTHAPGHIYWKNLDGVFLGCNAEHARYFGFGNPSDIVGKTNSDFLDDESAYHISDIDKEVMQDGQERIIEECVNGSQYFLSKKIPLRNHDNKIIGLLGTSINITEQKKLEANIEKTLEELATALDSKESFIKNMNHEIRIPMQLILNSSQLLKDNLYSFSDEEKLYFLDGMIKATNRLSDLVMNLLDMSKFKEGKFILNPKTENFLVLFDEIIQEFLLMYKNKITCEISLNDITHIKCDKIRIQQVLRNLLMNSIKYAGESTSIFVSLSIYEEEGGRYIKCSIKDQGIGIPTEEKDLLFKPFVGSSLTRDVPGSIGLGLTISKEIIQSHNGRIWIDDINEDEIGARISLIIPVE